MGGEDGRRGELLGDRAFHVLVGRSCSTFFLSKKIPVNDNLVPWLTTDFLLLVAWLGA